MESSVIPVYHYCFLLMCLDWAVNFTSIFEFVNLVSSLFSNYFSHFQIMYGTLKCVHLFIVLTASVHLLN